jgi:hypothetical protein
MVKLRRYDYEVLTVAIDGAEWLASRPVPFTPKKWPYVSHWIADHLHSQSRFGHRRKGNSFVPAGSGISIPRLFSPWPSRSTTAYRLMTINRLVDYRRDKGYVRETEMELLTLIAIQPLINCRSSSDVHVIMINNCVLASRSLWCFSYGFDHVHLLFGMERP